MPALRHSVSSALLGVALVGCAQPKAESVGTSDEAIQGGAVDAADTNVVDVVWLMADSAFSECSGSLIAPNLVLTAHHCVAAVEGTSSGPIECATASFGAPTDASNLYVSTAEVMPMSTTAYHRVRAVVVPPSSTGTEFCGVDQALLILDDVIAPTEAAPLVPRVDSEVSAAEAYTAVGFGVTMTGATDGGTRRELAGLHVDCVGASCASIAADQIDATREWIGDHGTCDGDSGGPALDVKNRVVGVTSRGGSGCSAPIYGSVFAWASWLRTTAVSASSEGGYPSPVWATAGGSTDPAYNAPIGGSCSDTVACPGAGTCVDEGGTSTCTRLCDSAAGCPTGMSCETSNGMDVCLAEPTGSSGCSSSSLPRGPMTPSPWLFGAGALSLLTAVARRRKRNGAAR